ncbi:MAG TPA: Rieske 2Fe-2S domain-containing protein [Pyrinomonadaceae bacterium]|nr:Rieske 2Fe-2S domain-containing protein [Pyrinomonadaceae bacterium]
MADANFTGSHEQHSNKDPWQPPQSRRAFLLLLPVGIATAVFASLASAAYRFLRPRSAVLSDEWIDVAPLAELHGTKPINLRILVEHTEGWAKSLVEHSVYVLPALNNQVLSPVCPHEGCEVAWAEGRNAFACPCHESNFRPDGSRINGPALRGLDSLPSRVEKGRLQVQFRYFANNTRERIVTG